LIGVLGLLRSQLHEFLKLLDGRDPVLESLVSLG